MPDADTVPEVRLPDTLFLTHFKLLYSPSREHSKFSPI